MAKRGKPRKTGGQSSLPPAEAFENLPAKKLPPPPVNLGKTKQPKLARFSRSPLSVAFRHIKPDWRRYIQFVDLAARKGDAAMARFLECYEGLDKLDKVQVWPEQLCELANVSPGELVGAVCRHIWESMAAESSMVSSIAHPQLLLDTIKFARKEENYRDRELYFRMMGSLPDRKGASINIFNAAAGQVNDREALSEIRQGPARLRTFDDEVVEMSRDLEGDPPFLVKDDRDVSP